ncbi:hypothetical protein HDU98_011322 [Podochytrium sp. JEL0797]|nr:hypothetical protein HDU98_011322 [Podochytrium sp. JEL0797]
MPVLLDDPKAQPPHLFAAVMPEMFLSKSIDWMFPVSWHQTMNFVWGVQIWILFLHCLYLRRWLPRQWESSREVEEEMYSREAGVELEQLSKDEEEGAVAN